MRIISFGDVKFVRAILEGSKTQTIRLLGWKNNKDFKTEVTNKMWKDTWSISQKKPIHKVGDQIKLVYKQRVLKKDAGFCKKCGQVFLELPWKGKNWEINGRINIDPCPQCKTVSEILPKHFATAEITDVFEIEMFNDPEAGFKIGEGQWNSYIHILKNGKTITHKGFGETIETGFMQDLAKRDGFKSTEEMFQWFDKRYDLSTSKRFAVYRFEVIK